MQLSIVFVNDVHGYIQTHPELFYDGPKEVVKPAGGYDRIASYIKEVRTKNPNTLVFDGGDTFHGTLPLLDSKGEAIVPVLNKLGFAAMVGHWDFAYGPGQVKNLAKQLNYPILGLNVHEQNDGLFLPPYVIKEVGGVKIAILGICCDVISKGMPDHFSTGLDITTGLEELPGNIARARDEGAEIVILMSHNGFPQDAYLLEKIDGIDICLSAHTHNRLYHAARINGAVVIQCGCHGAFAGRLDVEIQGGKVKDFSYQLVAMDDSIPSDPEVADMVGAIMRPYEHLKKEIAGSTAAILHRYNTMNSTMDDFLLEAVCQAAGCEVGFSNGWRYGAPIAAGDISKWDLYNIIPMNPPVSVVELTGHEIVQMIEKNLESTFSKEPMHQVGGYVKRCRGLSIDMRAENPKGYRVHEIYAGKKHMDRSAVYRVAFVTEQGVPKGIGNNRQDLAVHAVEAMEMLLQKAGKYTSSGAKSFRLV